MVSRSVMPRRWHRGRAVRDGSGTRNCVTSGGVTRPLAGAVRAPLARAHSPLTAVFPRVTASVTPGHDSAPSETPSEGGGGRTARGVYTHRPVCVRNSVDASRKGGGGARRRLTRGRGGAPPSGDTSRWPRRSADGRRSVCATGGRGLATGGVLLPRCSGVRSLRPGEPSSSSNFTEGPTQKTPTEGVSRARCSHGVTGVLLLPWTRRHEGRRPLRASLAVRSQGRSPFDIDLKASAAVRTPRSARASGGVVEEEGASGRRMTPPESS
jgi:hypothetical protein